MRPASATNDPNPPPRFMFADATNSAHINGRNLRYAFDPSGDATVDISYLSADLIDLTPQDPLSIWTPGSYQMNVQAARISADEANLNRALSGMLANQPNSPLKQAHVTLQDGDRFTLSGTLAKGLSLPFSLTAHPVVKDSKTLELQIDSVKVFGMPVTWLVKLLGLQHFLPANVPATGKGGSLTIDLERQALVHGDLKDVSIADGKLTVVMGGAPDPDVPADQRENDPNYFELDTKGEVALESAVLRNAKVVAVDATPQDPYTINRWDVEGKAKIQQGQVILTQDRLRSRFANAGGFSLDSLDIEGTDVVVNGSKSVLGFNIPVHFKLEFSPDADGALQVRPHDIRILGMGIFESQVFDAIANVKGMHRHGDVFTFDLGEAASAELPPLASVTGEPGRLVLQTR